MVFEPFSTNISIAKTLRAFTRIIIIPSTCAVISDAIVRSANRWLHTSCSWGQQRTKVRHQSWSHRSLFTHEPTSVQQAHTYIRSFMQYEIHKHSVWSNYYAFTFFGWPQTAIFTTEPPVMSVCCKHCSIGYYWPPINHSWEEGRETI